MQQQLTAPSLWLKSVAGPAIDPIEMAPDRLMKLGRSWECEVCLPDESVSRRHASIARRNDRWFLTDLGSRHGTMLDATRLTPNESVPLAEHDLIRIGPWLLRVQIGADSPERRSTVDDTIGPERVQAVDPNEADRVARDQLNLLIECAAALTGSTNEEDLAKTIIDSLLRATGFQRAAVLRAARGTDVEIIGHRCRTEDDEEKMVFSRSLLRAASAGQMVQLSGDTQWERGQSIAEMGITSALCAPIFLGPSVAAYIYLDARGHERFVEQAAAGYCQAMARMCGLALANIKRLSLEQRNARIESDLHAAREAQRLIVPAQAGEVGGLSYAMRMHPGHYVAGDLLEIVSLDSGVAVCIGDVTGEGAGAAVIMAITQAYLNAALRTCDDLGKAVAMVNKYVTEHSPVDRFITLWIGRIDPDTGVVRYIDAGHGHWLLKSEDAPARRIEQGGGIPLGIDAEFEYHEEEFLMERSDRLLLYTDGLLEQDSPDGSRFGHDRIIGVLDGTSTAQEDVDRLIEAVEEFAGTDRLADDVTVASFVLATQPSAGRG